MKKFRFLTSTVAALALAGASASAQDQPPPVRSGEDAVPARPGDGPGRDATSRDGEEQGFYRASEVLGSTVRGEGGEELGTVQDLMIDRQSQRISHFILSEDGQAPARRQDQPRATTVPEVRRQVDAQASVRVVPWSVARPQFTAQDRVLTVPLNQERWRQAPTYTWQEIQAGPRGGWYGDVNRFYGVQGGYGEQGGRGGRTRVERDGDVEIKDGRGGEVEIKRDGRVERND